MCSLNFIHDRLNRHRISIDNQDQGPLVRKKMCGRTTHSATRSRDDDPCARNASRQCAQPHKTPLMRLNALKPMLSQEFMNIRP
jgi:hypothetical protein